MAFNGFVQRATVSGTAAALASNQVFNTVTLAAKSTNTGSVFLGFSSAVSSSNGYELEKGTSVTIKVANANAVWIVGTASDILSVIGS